MLGVLGMAPLPEMPINDKIMHFFGVSCLHLSIPPRLNESTLTEVPML